MDGLEGERDDELRPDRRHENVEAEHQIIALRPDPKQRHSAGDGVGNTVHFGAEAHSERLHRHRLNARNSRFQRQEGDAADFPDRHRQAIPPNLEEELGEIDAVDDDEDDEEEETEGLDIEGAAVQKATAEKEEGDQKEGGFCGVIETEEVHEATGSPCCSSSTPILSDSEAEIERRDQCQ